MSRLDSFIARMQAQRLLLNSVCEELNNAGGKLPGPVIELGLGMGRTYDHLRELLPGRRIVVCERNPSPTVRSMPPAGDLLIGEIQSTALAFAAEYGAVAALVHADLGDGTDGYNLDLERWLPEVCRRLSQPSGYVLSSTRLDHPGLQLLPLPPEIKPGRYFRYRAN